MSLIEAAVAIIVLGIVLVGLFPLALDSIRLSVQNSEIAQANRIVASRLDQARTSLAPPLPCAPEGTPKPEGKPKEGKPLVLIGTENAKFTALRTVTCEGTLATVTVNVFRVASDVFSAASTAPVAATATTKIVTG